MGVYIKGITIEMLRNAPLEAVEDLLASGDMVEVTETHGRLIDANALMVYCRNQKSRTIDCNDIARFPTTAPRVIVGSEE